VTHRRDHGTTRTAGAMRRPLGRAMALLVALMTVAGMASTLLLSTTASAATRHAASTSHAVTTTGLGYTPISPPVRIADTRSGATDPATYAGKTLGPGQSLTVDMPSGTVPANAGAIVAQLTAVAPSNGGYLAAYPAGGTPPGTANVNFVAGQIVGNMVTVALGNDGSNLAVSILNGSGTNANTDFTLDLYGYYAPQTSSSGAAYVPLTPARISDTRTPSTGGGDCVVSPCPNAGGTLGAGGTENVAVTGIGGVPATATAVVVNIAVVNTTDVSYIEGYPTGSPPSSSTLTVNENWNPGEVLSTKAIIGVGTGGDITLLNAKGSTDVVVDVDGYFTAAGASGNLFNALASPFRLCDTRSAQGCAQGPVGANSSLPVTVAGASGSGIPANAAAGVLNVTDIANGPNYLTVYPFGQSVPTAADVNYTSGDTSNIVGNASYGTVGASGQVGVYNATSSANVVVDAFGYFAPVTQSVTVTATPSTLPSDGKSTSSISVTVMHNGSPVASDPVALTTSSSPSGVCTNANLSSTTGTTNAAGQVTGITYTASTMGGTCTITAQEAQFAQTGSTTITQTAPTNQITFNPTSASLAANGTATQTFTLTVKNPAGTSPVSGDALSFTTTPSGSGACGTLATNAGTTTNASGQVSATYVTSTTSGFCTITATEQATSPGTGGNASAVVTQTSSPAPANVPYTVAVSATPSSIPADGTTTSAITVTVADSTSAPVSGDPVMLTAAGAACGKLSSTTGTTSAAGTVTGITYTASTTAGAPACTITATEANDGQSGNKGITQTAVKDTVMVSASPSIVPADGVSTSAVTVTVTSASGPVVGDTVTFTPSGTCGNLSPSGPYATNASGQVSVTYTSSTTVGFCTITANETATGGSGSASIDQTTSTSTPTVTVTAKPATLQADGTSTSQITVTVKGSNGGIISGDPVSLTATGSPAGVCSNTNLSGTTGTTDVNGQVKVTYTASTTGGSCTITASEAEKGQSGSATITQTTNNTVTVAPTASTLPADGTTSTPVTVTVKSPTGTAVQGDGVTITTSAFPTGACGTVVTPSGTTNSSGQVTTAYVTSSTVGFCTLKATESGTGQSGSATITQEQKTAPANSPYTVKVSASPTSIAADGKTTSTVTATVTDTTSAPVNGDSVMFVATPDVTGGCGTLSTTTGTTGVTGTVTATYTASTVTGAPACTISATEAVTGQTSTAGNSAAITQTTPLNNVAISANPQAVLPNGTSSIKVTVTDFTGAAVSGDIVAFTFSAGCPASLSNVTNGSVTDANGVVTGTFTAPAAPVPPSCTVTATEGNTGASNSTTIAE
jgi:adhesin/invasin